MRPFFVAFIREMKDDIIKLRYCNLNESVGTRGYKERQEDKWQNRIKKYQKRFYKRIL